MVQALWGVWMFPFLSCCTCKKRKMETQGPSIRAEIWGYGSNPLMISYANNRITAVLLSLFSSMDSPKMGSTGYFLTDVILLLHRICFCSSHSLLSWGDRFKYFPAWSWDIQWVSRHLTTHLFPPRRLLFAVLGAGHTSGSDTGVGHHCLFLSSSLHDTTQACGSHHLCANPGLLHEELGAVNFLCVWVAEVGLALRKWQGWDQNIEILSQVQSLV